MAVQNKDLDENTKMPSLSKGYMQLITVLGHGIKGFNADEQQKVTVFLPCHLRYISRVYTLSPQKSFFYFLGNLYIYRSVRSMS